jgi:adenylosuccinate lyase
MPHKRNPEIAEHLGTLSRLVRANAGLLAEGLVHDHERDGRSWKTEWHAVPELTMASGKAHALLVSLLAGLEVDTERMRTNLDVSGKFARSEALMLALARHVGKESAHRIIHDLSSAARSAEKSFSVAVAADPAITTHFSREELDQFFSAKAQTGQCQALVDRLLKGFRRGSQS